ncbi:MAG: his operon leader peptide [Yersinia sp. (in: enterobacteria)]
MNRVQCNHHHHLHPD